MSDDWVLRNLPDGALSEPFSPVHLIRSGRWTSALLGTYVLSLSFFEGIVLPALRLSGVRTIDIMADVDGVAGALGEAGAREVGRTYDLQPLRVVGGVFHPKFLLLDGPDGPSALVGSGNLTFGGWGHNLELCEALRPDRAAGALRGIGDFLEELALTDRVVGIDAGRLEPWITRLRMLPASGNARTVHSVSTSIASQLATQAAELGEVARLTVAAPYFGSSGAVDELAADLGSPRVEVHVHDGERLAVNGHHFPFSSSKAGISPISLGLLTPAGSGPLHAKVVEIECELGCILMTGSANASLAALGQPRNVELGIVRVVGQPLTREAAEIPPRMAVRSDENTDAPAFGILQATLLGTCLRGIVLNAVQEGEWSAEFDHDGVVHDLGAIHVGSDGRFEGEVRVADASYGRRRSTVVLRRGDGQIRGFVSFPDAIELNNRWGAVIGPMIRVAGGSDDDDDLAGVLEYFASKPAETATAWRTSVTSSPRPDTPSRTISLSELAIHDAVDDELGHAGSGSRGALDRIIAALRVRWTAASLRTRGAAAEFTGEAEDDGEGENGSDARVVRAFDALLEVLAERVPFDPAVELLRAGDIAGFVLLRIPEPRRIAEFAAWWGNLAVRHLAAHDLDEEVRRMAAGMLMLDGLAASGPERTRGRLARVMGDVEQAVALATALDSGARIRRLVEVMGGADALEVFATSVREASSAVEEVIIAARHVAMGVAPPPLPLLDPTAEMRTIRRHIDEGWVSKIVGAAREARSCPRCNYALPEAQRLKLASIGLARAANCCNRVLLVGID